MQMNTSSLSHPSCSTSLELNGAIVVAGNIRQRNRCRPLFRQHSHASQKSLLFLFISSRIPSMVTEFCKAFAQSAISNVTCDVSVCFHLPFYRRRRIIIKMQLHEKHGSDECGGGRGKKPKPLLFN